MRSPVRRVVSALGLALLCAVVPDGATRRAAAERPTATGAELSAAWSATAADLVRRAKAGGHVELAAAIEGWDVPEPGDRQCVLAIPDVPPEDAIPDWLDTAAERSIWDEFLAARRTRAAGTFALAVAATRRPSPQPPRATAAEAPERRPAEPDATEAIRLLYRSLRDDPDHARAREAAGWVRRDGRWLWPEAARHLDRGEEHSVEFGWLPRGREDRYRAGERFAHGRWMTPHAPPGPAAPRAGPADPARDFDRQAWPFASDHWQITTTADAPAAADLARRLEEAHTAWRQVFGGFQHEPAEWERRLQGRGRPTPLEPFAARLTADRSAYVAILEPLEPSIARTSGLYWSPTRTAWFFVGGGEEPLTVHHEATHQLFAQTRRTSPLAGEYRGFWAIEAAACYLESLQPTAWGWTVGGRDAGRAAMARERLLEDGFHVPLAELVSMGRRTFQADDRLPQIYSEISGLADFFMNGERGRYRAAFVEYLTRIYTGTVDDDTLARLCQRGYADLDDAYRRHMAR